MKVRWLSLGRLLVIMKAEDKVGRVINVYSKKVSAELFLKIRCDIVLVF